MTQAGPRLYPEARLSPIIPHPFIPTPSSSARRTSSPDQRQPGEGLNLSGLTPARGHHREDLEGTHAQKKPPRAGLAEACSLRLQTTSPRMPALRCRTCAARGQARVRCGPGAFHLIPALRFPPRSPSRLPAKGPLGDEAQAHCARNLAVASVPTPF